MTNNISKLPFNASLGLLVENDSVSLVPAPQHQNHLGTVHATVVYGVAEAATGQWLLQQFPQLTESYVCVLRSSTVKYRRPAVPEVKLTGRVVSEPPTASTFAIKLEQRGRAIVEVDVIVTQNEFDVLTGVFSWFASERTQVK